MIRNLSYLLFRDFLLSISLACCLPSQLQDSPNATPASRFPIARQELGGQLSMMSDDEANFASGSAPNEDELSLPRATVQKLIQEMIPGDVTCSKECRELLIDCCVEFIHLVSSEANDVCEKASKKTIAPEHVVAALKDLGFESFTSEIEDVLKEHKTQQKDRERKTTRMEDSGLSAEELQRQQEMLFAASRARYEASN